MEIAGGRFVIAGGASLIGSHITDRLLQEGAQEIVLLDNLALGTPQTIAHLRGDPRVRLVRGDILRINELYDAFAGVDGVFAAAGFMTLPLTHNPPLGLSVNVDGMVNILEACRYQGVEKVVFSSSVAAYGEPGEGEIDESAPASLATVQPGTMLYACSKLIGEALCQLYHDKHGVQAIALRYATVYGERQHYRGIDTLYIVENYDRIMRGEAPVILGDGQEARDYIHAADVARANIMAMVADVSGETFNVATGMATSVARIVEIVQEITGSELAPVYTKASGNGRVSTGVQPSFSCDKIERMLGWRPEISVEEGLRRLIDWRRAEQV